MIVAKRCRWHYRRIGAKGVACALATILRMPLTAGTRPGPCTITMDSEKQFEELFMSRASRIVLVVLERDGSKPDLLTTIIGSIANLR
jgi:hypothetical protein